MLKEGWDVTNLYTIVPLRAANARILIEQSIGRGLRLPYGRRTGVTAVDRLNIVAHDRFQEIIDEANKPDSAIRLQAVVIDPDQLAQKPVTIVSQPKLAIALGGTAVAVDRLATLLWPDAEGDAARNSFDNALHRLRKLLGSGVWIGLDPYGLLPMTSVDLSAGVPARAAAPVCGSGIGPAWGPAGREREQEMW